MQISRKWFEIEAWYQLATNRKRPMADRMMMSSMSHLTFRVQGHDPNIFKACYFVQNSLGGYMHSLSAF